MKFNNIKKINMASAAQGADSRSGARMAGSLPARKGGGAARYKLQDMTNRNTALPGAEGSRKMTEPHAPEKNYLQCSYSEWLDLPDPPVEEIVEPHSFRNNLIKMLCYTAVVPIFMLGLFQSQQFQKAMRSADEAQLGMAQSIAESVQVTVIAAERVQQVLADAAGLAGEDGRTAQESLEQFIENRSRSTLSATAIVDEAGRVMASAARPGMKSLPDNSRLVRSWIQKAHGGAFIDVLREGGQPPRIAVIVRQKSSRTAKPRFSVTLYSTDFLEETVRRVLNGRDFDVAIVDREGCPVGEWSPGGTGRSNMALEGLEEAEASIRAQPSGLLTRTPGTRNVSQIKAYVRLEDLGWTVALSQPVKVRDQVMLASLETSGLFFLIAILLTLFVGTMMNRPLTRAVNNLMDAVETFGRTGRFKSVVEDLEKDGISEIVELGKSFERMVDMVSESRKKLEKLNAELEEKVTERTYTLLSRNSELRALQQLVLPLQGDVQNRNEALRQHVAGCVDQFRVLLGFSRLDFVSERDPAPWRDPAHSIAVELSGKTYGWLVSDDKAVFTPDRVDSLRRLANALAIVLANNALVGQLAKEHATLSVVFESVTDGIVILGRSGRVIYANEFALQLLNDGRPLLGAFGRELIERLFGQSIPDESEGRHVRLVRRLSRGVTQTIDVVGFMVSDLPGFPGERRGWLIRDISREAGIDAMKENLVSVVAPELKTPVTALRLLAESMKHDAEAGRQSSRQDVGELLEETLRLGQLIDDLLDISRIEGGAMKLDRRLIQLASVIDRAARLAKSRYPLEVSRDIDCDAEVVCADPLRLTQVFINLFVNAARYRKPGQAAALCRVTVCPGSGGTVVIQVRDEGQGIAPERLARIFEPFYQSDMTIRRNGSGAGLGLTIVKGIMEAHRGEVSVQSEPGVSTTFTLVLPA